MPISSDNRRIAKNTLALYVRMAVMMAVSLFTSRVVLQTLGVEDFGIYNVVGGVVVLFSFLNAAMSSATQRFLNFELGRNDIVQAGRVFSMSVNVHFVIAGTVFLLAETIGLWFLNMQLNIPAARMEAANWVYQFSVFSTLLGIMLVPYNATIIAHERMGFYAWASVGNAILRLLIVYMLYIGNFDKLILYAILTFAVGVIMQIVNVAYCKKAFPQVAVYRPFWERKLFGELISFSGWSLFGGVANMCNSQGINMVLNIFCGVAVNAAMGIANQVNAAVYQFVSNFQVAFNPQIIKHYSAGEQEAFISLIFRASKISYFMMFFLALPLMLNAEFVLKLWLGIVPEYSAQFLQWILVFALIESLTGPLWMSIQAAGKIRNYQLIVSSLIFVNLPLSIILLWCGYSPVWVMAGRVFVNFFIMLWRIFYLRNKVNLPSFRYLKDVLIVVICSTFVASIIPVFLFYCVPEDMEFLRFFSSSIFSVFSVLGTLWFIGLNQDEKKKIVETIKSKF